MKKIVLLCGAGMSSSLLMMKMREEAKKEGLDCEINAYSLYVAIEKGLIEGDCILIGPQVRLSLDKVRQLYPNIPSEVIDMNAYGMMDGRRVLVQAIKLMKRG